MSALSNHHRELDTDGRGRCSVPMWGGGSPSGFCDREAYGERLPTRFFWNYSAGREVAEDGGYAGYVPALACPGHGGPKTRVFLDGNAWCAVHSNFINLQESPAGFGDTPQQARTALAKEQP
ncbi:MAG TPA: hypothetical protein VMA55_11940 [Acidovorax sp.]|nr:hypothetical protein [Acidovorax sp.]